MLIGLTQTKLHPRKGLKYIYIYIQVRLFDIIFMFIMTDFIIFAERFTFF